MASESGENVGISATLLASRAAARRRSASSIAFAKFGTGVKAQKASTERLPLARAGIAFSRSRSSPL
jgi:hypothetical protein